VGKEGIEMKNTNETGGPAFPMSSEMIRMQVAAIDEMPEGKQKDQIADAIGAMVGGMMLRDYFAAKASEEDIKHFRPKGFTEQYVIDNGYGGKEVARRPAMWTREQARYIYADAMIEARK
jgi:hypothetical protein